MYNKGKIKVQSTAKKKTSPWSKDVLMDPLGQWKFPGQVTKVPSSNITMAGVPYPVLGEDEYGNKQMMYPEQDYQFPGNMVTEYPMAQQGGEQQPMHQMPDGSWMPGATHGEYEDVELTDEEVAEYKRGGFVVEELPTAQGGTSVTERIFNEAVAADDLPDENNYTQAPTKTEREFNEAVELDEWIINMPPKQYSELEQIKRALTHSSIRNGMRYKDVKKESFYPHKESGGDIDPRNEAHKKAYYWGKKAEESRKGIYDKEAGDNFDKWAEIAKPEWYGEHYTKYYERYAPAPDKIQPRSASAPMPDIIRQEYEGAQLPPQETYLGPQTQTWDPITKKYINERQYQVIPEPSATRYNNPYHKEGGGDVLKRASRATISKPKQSLAHWAQDKINKELGYPMKFGEDFGYGLVNNAPGEDPSDSGRHAATGFKVSEELKKKGWPELASFMGSVALGAGHEVIEPNRDEGMSWGNTIREGAEDIYNNTYGAYLSAYGNKKLSEKQKLDHLRDMVYDNKLPDGHAIPDGSNMYFKEEGGEIELTDAEVEEYRRGGFVVEELPQAQDGLSTSVNRGPVPDFSNPTFYQAPHPSGIPLPTRDVAGTLKKTVKQPLVEKAYDIASNPLTALANSRNGIPDNLGKAIETGNLDRNALEMASDVLNPVAYVNLARDTYRDVGAGNYGMAALNAASMIPGLGVIGKGAKKIPFDKTYKINPWAFKSNPDAYYRGIGRTGYDDAIESGVLRTANKTGNYGEDLYMTKDFNVAKGNYSKNREIYKGDPFGGADEPFETILPKDSKSYIAEIPKSSLTNPVELRKHSIAHGVPIIINKGAIPLDNVKLLKQHWRRGYKEVLKKVKKKYGGAFEELELTDEQVAEYRAGGYVVDEMPAYNHGGPHAGNAEQDAAYKAYQKNLEATYPSLLGEQFKVKTEGTQDAHLSGTDYNCIGSACNANKLAGADIDVISGNSTFWDKSDRGEIPVHTYANPKNKDYKDAWGFIQKGDFIGHDMSGGKNGYFPEHSQIIVDKTDDEITVLDGNGDEGYHTRTYTRKEIEKGGPYGKLFLGRPTKVNGVDLDFEYPGAYDYNRYSPKPPQEVLDSLSIPTWKVNQEYLQEHPTAVNEDQLVVAKQITETLANEKKNIIANTGMSESDYDQITAIMPGLAKQESDLGNALGWQGLKNNPKRTLWEGIKTLGTKVGQHNYDADLEQYGSKAKNSLWKRFKNGPTEGVFQVRGDMLFKSIDTRTALEKLGITEDNYDPDDIRQNTLAAMVLMDNNLKTGVPSFDDPKKKGRLNRKVNPETGELTDEPLALTDKLLYLYNNPGAVAKGNAQGEAIYNKNVNAFDLLYPQYIVKDAIELPTYNAPLQKYGGTPNTHTMPDGTQMPGATHAEYEELDLSPEEVAQYKAGGFVVEEIKDGGEDVKYNTPEYNQAYGEGTVTKYNPETDVYQGQDLPEFQVVDKKPPSFMDEMDFLGHSVLGALGELTPVPAAWRIMDDPKGAAKGTGQTLADIAMLGTPGANMLAMNQDVNPITGVPYGTGLSQALDVAGVIPELGAAAKALKLGKYVKQGLKGLKGLRKTYPTAKETAEALAEIRRNYGAGMYDTPPPLPPGYPSPTHTLDDIPPEYLPPTTNIPRMRRTLDAFLDEPVPTLNEFIMPDGKIVDGKLEAMLRQYQTPPTTLTNAPGKEGYGLPAWNTGDWDTWGEEIGRQFTERELTGFVGNTRDAEAAWRVPASARTPAQRQTLLDAKNNLYREVVSRNPQLTLENITSGKASRTVGPRNASGFTKEDVLKIAKKRKDKNKIGKMTADEFSKTIVKPNGEIAPYVKGTDIKKMKYSPEAPGAMIHDTAVPMPIDEYVQSFNDNIHILNDIINKNNKSGELYSAVGLNTQGRLAFNSPSGMSAFNTRINPGQWRGQVEDIANTEYYRSIPGLEMSNTGQTVFGHGIPKKGTGTYKSINEYLKKLDLGRVKPGFNSQTAYSQAAWENAVRSGKSVGFYKSPRLVHGVMKTLVPGGFGLGAAGALSQNKYGGDYQDVELTREQVEQLKRQGYRIENL